MIRCWNIFPIISVMIPDSVKGIQIYDFIGKYIGLGSLHDAL